MYDIPGYVAPFTGAWIETVNYTSLHDALI